VSALAREHGVIMLIYKGKSVNAGAGA